MKKGSGRVVERPGGHARFPLRRSLKTGHLPVAFLFLGFWLLASSAVFPSSPVVRRDSLPNGIVVLSCPDPRLPIVSLALVCRSGAAFDPADKAGTAGITATLLTRGSRGVSADSLASIVEFLGAQFGAAVDHDRAVLMMQLLSKDLAQGLSILSSAVMRPSLAPAELRLALDQSLAAARRRNDHPRNVVAQEFSRLVFGAHPYGRNAYGDTASLRRIGRDDVLRFHRTHYLPNNSFIVAVGDFAPDELLRLVSDAFGTWPRAGVPAVAPPPPPRPDGIRVKVLSRPEMNQTYVEFGHPGISIHDDDVVAARLMSYVLGGSALSSRLGIAVREKAGLAYDVRCWFDRMDHTGAFHASVQTANPQKAIDLMMEEVALMRDSGATAREVLKAHNYFTGSFPLSYSSNQGKLQQLMYQETYRLGDDWLARFPDEVRAVTLEDVNRAARGRLDPDNCWMVIMGPVTQEDVAIPGAQFLD